MNAMDGIRFSDRALNTTPNESRELNINDLDEVNGGSWFGWVIAATGNGAAGDLINNGSIRTAGRRYGPIE